jgi:hypothetical protein
MAQHNYLAQELNVESELHNRLACDIRKHPQ